MANETLLIGIDAGDFRTIDRLADQGQLPTLNSMIDRGFHATLESSVPPWTPTAWTSLTSGKNPGKHGIFDFKTTDQKRLVNAGDVRTNRIWDYLSIQNKKSIILNVPVTNPAPEVNGVLIPGYLGPEIGAVDAQPAGVVEELQDEIGAYRIYKHGSYESDDALCDEYVELMKMRRDAIIYLCDAYPWEFAMVQFQRTDTVFHELPEERHIERVYSEVDGYIRDIIDALDPETTVIASDHGMGTTGEWDFRINTWLQRKGLLESSLNGLESGWKKPTEGSTSGENRNGIDRSSRISRAMRSLSAMGLTPQFVESVLARLGVDGLVKEFVPASLLQQAASSGEKIDIEESRAYCPSGPGLGVYCDDDVKSTLIDELRGVTLPGTSEALFEWVKPSETVFEGPHTANGPDVLMLPKEMNTYLSATISATAFEPSQYRYNHKSHGVLIGSGPSVSNVSNRCSTNIYDITPTILSMVGVPVDPSFDGEQIEDLLSERVDEEEYPEHLQRQTEEELDGVESRLGDLGYL